MSRAGSAARAVPFEGATIERERTGIENSAAPRAPAVLARHETRAAKRAVEIDRAIHQCERADVVDSPTFRIARVKVIDATISNR